MYISQSTHFEIAHRNSREGDKFRLSPVVVGHNVLSNVEAKQVKFHAENFIEDEHLTYDVGDVQKLGKQEEQNEVVPKPGGD